MVRLRVIEGFDSDMKLLKNALVLAAFVCSLAMSVFRSGAQDLESGQLLNPAPDTWPLYHGDYSGRRHIHLTQITPQNVGDLTLAWAFQTNQTAEIKSSPLLVDGVLYFTVPDNIWAVDARSGHMIWHYNQAIDQGTISAIAASRCTRGGSTSPRPMRT